MWRRTAAVTCSLAAVPVLLGKVHAAEDSPEKEDSATSSRKMRASELPLYGSPPAPEYQYIAEEVGQIRKQISVLRKAVWKVMDYTKGTTDKVQEKYEIGKAHSADFLTYLREDSAVIPKGTFIVVAMMGGALAGYRRGSFRQATYATLGGLSAASLCYPNEATDIVNTGWSQVKGIGMEIVKPGSYKKITSEPKEAEPPAATSEETGPGAAPTSSPSSPQKEDTSLMDHGMSNPEDKDMYSTRES